MTDTPSFDEIPVLTEVVVEPKPVPAAATVAEELAAAEQAAAGEAPAVTEAPAAAGAEAIPVLETEATLQPAADQAAHGDDAWRELEDRLVTRVLDRLTPRIDVVLEDQVRDQMAIVLDHVAERLGLELRSALQQSIEHVVARAVQQELAHLTARQS